jgi:hypothetical protein
MSNETSTPTRDEMTDLARQAWGPENAAQSTRDELRFGNNGSKSVDLKKLKWKDFETGEGGGYPTLYKLVHGHYPNGGGGLKDVVTIYPYHDEQDALLYEVVRKIGHKFLQRRPNGNGGWTWKLGDVRRVLYKLPELLVAQADSIVFVCEGEKDVDALRALGLVATTNPGGAVEHKDKTRPYRGKWRNEYSDFLRDRHVVILPDNDDPGRDHAQDVARKVHEFAASVRILELPDLPEKGDVSDWLANGGTADELDRLARDAPLYQPPEKEEKQTGFNLDPQTGLWFQTDGANQSAVWICAPFEVLGDTADERDCEHGLWLRWTDNRRVEHTWALPIRLIHADGGGLAAELHSMGLKCGTSRAAHDLLKQYLGRVRADRHVRCVNRAGWHVPVYVLPNGRIFGGDDVVMQADSSRASAVYAERGTLAQWQQRVAKYADGNGLLTFTISAAFAPPLLDISGFPSGGIHLHGGSQTGKTTIARGAASVWGPAEDGLQIRSWRSTANALEGAAGNLRRAADPG